MSVSNTPPRSRANAALRLAQAANLALVGLQLLLVLPAVAQKGSFDWAIWHIDALGLTFGVAWPLTLAVALSRRSDAAAPRFALLAALVGLALAGMAYSRDLLQLLIAGEVALLALRLILASSLDASAGRALAIAMHAPGLVLLVLALVPGAVFAFVPPAGGTLQTWSLPATVALGAVVLARAGCWPFNGWARNIAGVAQGSVVPVFALSLTVAPYLLAKALVGGRWEPRGAWTLVLLGTIALIAAATASLSKDNKARSFAIASAHAAAALIGFGMASGSPLAGMGALALMLTGALWAGLSSMRTPYFRALPLLGDVLGLWATAQGTLGTGYGLVAAILLPLWALMSLSAAGHDSPKPSRRSLAVLAAVATAIALAFALFPQGVVEWVLRPAVGAMAGGVGALFALQGQWGLGVLARGANELVLAALPATGIALAVGLAMVTLYWLGLLLGRFFPAREPDAGEPDEYALTMDDILPGAERAGQLTDPTALAVRLVGRK